MSEDIIASMSLNKILIAILEEYGQMTIPTLKFVDAGKEDKELVIEYDDKDLVFKISLRGKTEDGSVSSDN
jgi:hypothetical protein